jgi:hypothetical protein
MKAGKDSVSRRQEQQRRTELKHFSPAFPSIGCFRTKRLNCFSSGLTRLVETHFQANGNKNPAPHCGTGVHWSSVPRKFTSDHADRANVHIRDNVYAGRTPPRVAAHIPVPDTRPRAMNRPPGPGTPPWLARKRRQVASNIPVHCRYKPLMREPADNPTHSQSPLRRRHQSKSFPQLPTPGRLLSRSGDLPRPSPGQLPLVSFFSYLTFRCRKLSVRRNDFHFIHHAVTLMLFNVI